MNQRSLVERAGEGDHDAFAILVRSAIARLDAAARLIVRDPELASDAVQDALMRAWRDLPGLRDPDRFDAWIHRLTIHSCLDLLRRRRRRAIEVELGPFDGPDVSDMQGLVADRDSLDRALRRLDPDQRAVIVVHYFLGVPLSETAAMLEIPVGTAKSRLNRSLMHMRVAIEADAAPLAARYPGGHPA